MRNFNFYISGMLSLFLLASCSKNELINPDFEVTTSSNTYNLEDTVTFNFKGSPDNITFYSGDVGNNYDYRERTRTAGNALQVNFNTWGNRAENITLLASNEFSGILTKEEVDKGAWKDITKRAVFSTGTDQTPSGKIDLSDFSDKGTPIYLAFKYTTSVLNQANRRWVVRSINFENKKEDGTVSSLAVMSTAGWGTVSFGDPANKWVVTAAQLLNDSGATVFSDDWVISKGFDVGIVKPDAGVAIKSMNAKLTSHRYKFSKAGTYKVIFIASNQIQAKAKTIMREMTLVIK